MAIAAAADCVRLRGNGAGATGDSEEDTRFRDVSSQDRTDFSRPARGSCPLLCLSLAGDAAAAPGVVAGSDVVERRTVPPELRGGAAGGCAGAAQDKPAIADAIGV